MEIFDIPLLPRLNLIGFFAIKLLAGFSLWAVYSYYYAKSDVMGYFNKSEVIYNTIFSHPDHYIKLLLGIESPEFEQYYSKIRGWNPLYEEIFFNDGRTMIRLNAFLRLFSFGNFHVHTVIMCFVSFIGLTAIYKTFIRFFSGKQMWLIFAVFFIPTVLYWSSGVLKESILVTGIGFLIYSTQLGQEFPKNKKRLFLFIFSVLILLSIKMYVLLLLLPALLANFLYSKSKKINLFFSYVFIYSAVCLLLIVMAYTNKDYNIINVISDKQVKAISEAQGGIFLVNDKNFVCVDYEKGYQLVQSAKGNVKIKEGSSYLQWKLDNMQDTTFVSNSTDTSSFKFFYTIIPANSALPFNKINPTVTGFIKNIPFAIYHSLFRTSFIKPDTVFELIAVAESQMILIFMALALFFYKKPHKDQIPAIIFCVVVAFSLFILIGFTTPVFGAMVRYKLPALLFLVIALFLIIDFNKIKNKLFGSTPVFNVSSEIK